MNPAHEFHILQNRRQFFQGAGLKAGGIALASMLGRQASGDVSKPVNMYPALSGFPHFAPKAKRLVYLHMNGAPSQIDLFDHKPRLHDYFDQELPDSIRNGQRITTMTSGQKRFPVAPSKFKFDRCGQSGIEMSELVPHMKTIADEIAMVRSVHTEAINHDPACTFVMTGSEVPGKPSIGSWLSYGLGSDCQNLPSFVVFTPTVKNPSQALFTRMWSSGFLPSKYDGVKLRGSGDPVLYVKNPPGVSPGDRRTMLDALSKLNRKTYDRFGDPETQSRIAQYEMAFRMQASVPDLTDLSNESKKTLEMYGPNATKPGTYAHSALLTRRLIERDVRVVQILHRGWDQHGSLPAQIKNQCMDVDQPTAALIKDLKQRGLLEDTLVVFGGEFGRTVYCQGKLTRENYGRDHHPRNFCIWMAGGGVRPGITYGATDDFSYNIAKDPVHLNEVNATILHLMGVDHSRFVFPFQGLEQRLTGVEEVEPVKAIMA
ncbi:MAG: sulfatase [Verrucomicrobia bacterium]|nr:sulfatase [Verrucomicrobiota bacterium]